MRRKGNKSDLALFDAMEQKEISLRQSRKITEKKANRKLTLGNLPDKTPCVTNALTSIAPCAINVSAAKQRVPQVSAMSSTIMANFPLTSPVRSMPST